jgi:hypothetical protein
MLSANNLEKVVNNASVLTAVALFIICCDSAIGAADVIPLNVIENQHKACVASCIKSSGGKAARCEKACSCIDEETEKTLSATDYMDMTMAIRKNPNAPDFSADLREKINHMILVCG